MPTATELLTEMRPAWGAALGGRVSPEYLAAFIGRHQRRLESALEPIADALAAVPTVNVYEVAEDVARRLRGLSEIANALANTSDTFGIEIDRQLPKVMLEYLPTLAGGHSQGAGAPERWAIYRRWSDDSAFRRKLREQVYELLWDRRPGWSTSDAAEIEEARAEKEKEARTQLQSTRLRNTAAKLAERRVKVAADSIALLRRQDVERVLNETPSAERRQVAYVLGERRPELVDEIDEVMREVLGEPANWSTYGRDEIYQPGSRARREAALAENEAPVVPIWRSSEATVASEFEVDGTKCTIFIRPPGYHVRVMDGGLEIDLDTLDGSDLRAQAESRLESMLNPRLEVALLDQRLHDSIQARNKLAAERVVHVFTLAARHIADGRLTTKVHSQPTPAEDVDREVAEPSADEAERELAALAAEDGKPRPVVMASLEAGGIILLHPHSYLGGDLFQTYRDATSKLQYVSYPKKGQRGVPSKVARAVLALERDGFEVRAEDPEVIKSLIVQGGLDHALAVGPPPPREAAARPNTRTSDPALIARVEAMAADPPTSTVKYLAKVLRLNGNLPLQVIDWQNGGKRTLESALEEGEAKVARKLARRPKAERLRDDGVERRAKDANEEHAAQALVQLADMDPDKAREVNEAGFSKSDVSTGHTLARRWEATGELTGDEWAWAVEVANKYRRQVGPLPEPKGKPKRQRSKESEMSAEERLFVGVMPTGIVYADRSREVDGDYTRCAFLPYTTLALEVAPKCPKDMLRLIEAHAATIIAKRGEKFPISASNQTVVLGSKYVDVPSTSSAALTNTPSGRVHLSPAASRMLAKMTDGAWALTFSHKDTESIAAAIELRDVGLAEIADHHGDPRVALPMLTVDNHERASTILNVAHPEWGIKRFNRDPSGRGHHSFGTGSTSAVLFTSDFSGWVVASWLPTAAEVAAEHAEREAYLDEHRPGWRDSAKAKATRRHAAATAEPAHDLGWQYSSQSRNDLMTTADGIVTVLKQNLAKLYASYKLEIHATRAIGDNSVTITFYRVPPNADDLEAANAKSKVRINIHGEGRGNEPTWSGEQTPARLTAYTVWDVNAPKFRKRSGPIQAIVTAVVDWFVSNAPELMGEALSRIDLNLLRALVAIREEADRTNGADDEAHTWARGSVVPDGKHVTAALIGRSVQVAGLTDGHYRRLSERGLLERRSTDLGGGLVRVRYSVTPAGIAAVAAAPPVDNRKLEAAEKRAQRKKMQADIEAHNAAIIARRQAASTGEESEEERMGRLLRAGRDVEEAQWEADLERGTRAEIIANGLGPDEARKAAVANLGRDRHYYEKLNEEKWGHRP